MLRMDFVIVCCCIVDIDVSHDKTHPQIAETQLKLHGLANVRLRGALVGGVAADRECSLRMMVLVWGTILFKRVLPQ